MAPANRMPSQIFGRPGYDSLHLPDSRRTPAAHGPGWDGHPTGPLATYPDMDLSRPEKPGTGDVADKSEWYTHLSTVGYLTQIISDLRISS